MARALRRTLAPQSQERYIGGRSMSSATLLQKGGGSVVFAVGKAYDHTLTEHKHVSSLTPLAGGMAGSTGFSSSSLPTLPSHSDGIFSFSNLSVLLEVPWLRLMGRTGGSMERLPKSRGSFFRRPMLQFLLCLVLGIVMGVTSIGWSEFASSRNEHGQDLAVINDFITNFQNEGSQKLKRGEKLVEFDSWRSSTDADEIDDVSLDEERHDKFRDLQVEHIETSLLDVAPGLNYTLDPTRKLLIIVTPTYNRAFQAHHLTRLAHTLRLVPPPLLWLVVEMPYQTLETAALLRQTGIMYRHLVCRNNATSYKDRGVHQRNFALEHIEMHQLNGIVYFADDDNVYSQELFEHMRTIRRFGTWPVAMLAESKAKVVLEGPVCDGERVIGWHTSEKSKRSRRFHVDMSGFAFNSTFLWDTANWRHRSDKPIRQLDTVKEGFQETTFIEQLVEDERQMEGLPSECKQILVWHQYIEAPELIYPYGWSLANPLFPNIPLQAEL